MSELKDIEPADEIVPRILEQYSNSPRGWRVLSTPIGDMLVVGPESAFQLKLISINPQEFTGAGIEIPESNATIDSLRASPEYGLRPLDRTDIRSLIDVMSNPTAAHLQLESIINRELIHPRDLSKTKAEHLLTGPVFTRPELGSMSHEIRDIQASLEVSAQKIFRKKYPMRAGMFY